MADPAMCFDDNCTRKARMAVKTSRTKTLTSTIFYDDRAAPATAPRYCKQHGMLLVQQAISALVAGDD